MRVDPHDPWGRSWGDEAPWNQEDTSCAECDGTGHCPNSPAGECKEDCPECLGTGECSECLGTGEQEAG